MTLYNYIYVYLILESCVKSCWNQHNTKCFKTNALQAAEIAADKDTPDPVIIPEHDVITRRKQFRMKKDRKEARTQKKLKKKAEADDKKKLKEEKKRARDAKKLDKEKKKHDREDKKKEKEAAKAGAKKHQPGSKSQKYTPSAKETAKEGMDADGEDMIHTTHETPSMMNEEVPVSPADIAMTKSPSKTPVRRPGPADCAVSGSLKRWPKVPRVVPIPQRTLAARRKEARAKRRCVRMMVATNVRRKNWIWTHHRQKEESFQSCQGKNQQKE